MRAMWDMKILAVVGSIGAVSGAAGYGTRWLLAQAGAPPTITSLGEWISLPIVTGIFAAGGAWAVSRLRQQKTDEAMAKMEARIAALDARLDASVRDRVHVGEFGALKEAVKELAHQDVIEVYEKNTDRLLLETFSKNEHTIYCAGVERELDKLSERIEAVGKNAHDLRSQVMGWMAERLDRRGA